MSPRGFPVFTLQKRQPRVHVSPRIMIVAVPAPQHSAMFGHAASFQTVCSESELTLALTRSYSSPIGNDTRSQSGFLFTKSTLTATLCLDRLHELDLERAPEFVEQNDLGRRHPVPAT